MNKVESLCLPPNLLLPAVIFISRHFCHLLWLRQIDFPPFSPQTLRQIFFAKVLLTRLAGRRCRTYVFITLRLASVETIDTYTNTMHRYRLSTSTSRPWCTPTPTTHRHHHHRLRLRQALLANSNNSNSSVVQVKMHCVN